jgi:hypothetical protein
MKPARWRVVLPVVLLLTVLTPALRSLPGGNALPDPWLLLMLSALPVLHGEHMRHALRMVLLFGLLRASVSAVSPFSSWAGLAGALVVREQLHRRLSNESFWLRLGTGAAAAIPATCLDWLEGQRLGLDMAGTTLLWRIIWVGAWIALIRRPGPLNRVFSK